MNTLFDILDGVIDASGSEGLTVENVSAYAENGMDTLITDAQAALIVEVGKNWLHEQANGNGEWSRMRHDAIDALAE